MCRSGTLTIGRSISRPPANRRPLRTARRAAGAEASGLPGAIPHGYCQSRRRRPPEGRGRAVPPVTDWVDPRLETLLPDTRSLISLRWRERLGCPADNLLEPVRVRAVLHDLRDELPAVHVLLERRIPLAIVQIRVLPRITGRIRRGPHVVVRPRLRGTRQLGGTSTPADPELPWPPAQGASIPGREVASHV